MLSTKNKIFPLSMVQVSAMFLIAFLVSGCVTTHSIDRKSLRKAEALETREKEVSLKTSPWVTGTVIFMALGVAYVVVEYEKRRSARGDDSLCGNGNELKDGACYPTLTYAVNTLYNNLVGGYGDLATKHCGKIKSSTSNARYVLSNNPSDPQKVIARYANYLGWCVDEVKGKAVPYKWVEVKEFDIVDYSLLFTKNSNRPLDGDIIVSPFVFNGFFPYANFEVDDSDIPKGGFPWVFIWAGDNRFFEDDPFKNLEDSKVEFLIANLEKGIDNFAILTSSTGDSLRCVNGSDSKRKFPDSYYELICSRFIAFPFITRTVPTDEQLEGTTLGRFAKVLETLDPFFRDGVGTSFSAAGVGVVLTAIMKIYDLQRADQALDILFAAATPVKGASSVVNLEALFNANEILRTKDKTLGVLGLKFALFSTPLPYKGDSVNVVLVDNFGRPLNVGFDVARSYGFQSVVCKTFCSNHKLTNWLSVDFGDNLIGTGFHLGNLSLSFKENVNGSKDFFGNHLGSGSVERSVTSLSYKTKFVELSSYKDDRNAKAFGLGIDGSVYSHSVKFNLPLKKVHFDLSLTSKEFSGSVNAGGYSLDLANIKQKDITFKAVIPF